MFHFDRCGRQVGEILRSAHIVGAEARAPAVTVEHLLLSLAWTDPELLGRFASVNSVVVELCRDVPRLTAPGAGAEEIALSPDVVRVLRRADEEAGGSEIAPEHVLLAIMREENGRAVDLLRSQGVDFGEVERFVRPAGGASR
jgi:ATP-dependent Clp protease ATP-binding subunit ClpC